MSLQESVTPSPADTPADLEPQDNTSQETTSTSAVLVVQANSAEEPAEEDSSLIRLEPPFLQFLCNLTEKGIAQKFYVNTVLENELQHEALLDTAADITLMSSTLFNRLRNMVQQSNRDIKLQPCAMEIRPYSTDSTTLKTMTMLNISIGPMKIMHPVYVSPLESIPFLIGQDLLKRFEPLIDYRQLKIWAQVRRPLPIPATNKNRAQCCALTRELSTSTPTSVSSPERPYLTDDEPQPCSWPFDDSVIKRDTFLCKFDDTNGPDTPGPLITEGINLNENHVNDVILALWADKSAISRELYDALSRDDPNLQCVRKAFRFPLDSLPKATMTAEGVCALTVRWNKREMTHHFLVIPDLPHQVYMGSDMLVRLAVQVDTINNILWSLTSVNEESQTPDVDNIISGQSIPEACQVANELDIVVPAMTTNVPIRLNLQRGQKLLHTQAFFQPSLLFLKLGLSTQATPLLELHSRFTHLLVQNTTSEDILIPKSTPLGWLISTSFHDFELRIPVIGKMPRSLMSDHSSEQVFHTLPSRAISLFPTVPLDHDTICQVDLSEDSQMILHTVQVLSVSSEPETAHTLSGVEPSIFPTGQTPEHDPDFDAKVEQLVAEADALNGEKEREKLRKLLHKYRASFAKDSLDCGLTSIHSIRIPTPPDAPPTFVRQYKIPLASYEPIQEIIDDLLAKGIIRPCNSTYSAPLWPVLKPNGKWRLTIDYRKLNQQVPLSRWPMAQLQQDLPKITDARYFSTLDVASGFWTIPVQEADQHKLAFTFANRQYTFTRCPFGYANSPAEFNIFLNKACPDASERGTLIYVNDILMRSHLAEIDHVLNQLTNAGAKISLSKCQWCRTKVNYVGLLVGPTGVEPQLSRIQGLSNLKAPTNVSELRSFLGVCNYSRQFIEDYADLAKPLTNLLKKDVPFTWGPPQQHAMQALKDRLCAAPCLAYPDCNRPFYLEVGFSCHCLSAGLYQIHDSDKRVVAYASKTLLAPELKFSDCEKALLATVWAVKHFSNYLGGQKVIVETNHQPVTFLNSQRIRDGVVTNARVASWLMALQSFDIEVHYAQNRKTPLGMELAACQSCLTDSANTGSPTCDPEPPELSCHRYFDDNVCKDMITAYVDGCSYHHDTVLRAGVGVVWVNDEPCEPLSFNLGAQMSQYAEVAGILIVLQLAVEHKIHALTICTDSNYARLSFSCHLPLWKRNGFLTSNRKPVKHKDLFLTCDFLPSNHDLQIYWKKVRGHSRIPGPDKMFNDQADSLAKQGALTGSNWHFEPSVFPLPPVPLVCAVTRAQSRAPPRPAPSGPVSATVASAFSDSDLLVLQASDPAIAAMTQFLSGPPDSSMAPALLDSIPGLRHVFRVRSSLRLVKGFLVYVSDALTSPALVVPHSHRGVMLTYAHDTPCAGHRGNKATLHALQQVAYWPHMQKDVADYIKGCLVCCQFQPANPLHRAPLQRRGISFPWSDLQIDWVGPLTKSARGNKYFLTVVCAFTKWVECLPAPNDTAQTTAYLLMNHIFLRFGLPTRVDSDRGTHFTSEVMQQLWQLLGVKANFHISHHPLSSGQVERANRTVETILKKYVSANHKDWDVKLPLVLMAIRATPHGSTGFSPFELMTGRQMTLPLHLLYQPGEASIATAYTTHQYMTDLHQHLKATFAFTQEHLSKSAEGRKSYYDQKASQQELQVGDKVWYYLFTQPTGDKAPKSGRLARKFLPRWASPYLITEKLSSVVYQIKIAKGNKEPTLKWVHRNQIKLHHNPMGLVGASSATLES
ncbi:hypothetical protein LDENG_00238730%2C partial [Xyrichtys novacula]|uniref:Gypsy retrotransposon integrase-like protein 1 n=1 Tax=Xyrichtys novacula TaxID=13765 RepID=A0AAV1F9J0_XYRNO|nr:hypothetical protein LDENG_00238730%2C partial [Xyrichtys novacula]